MYFDEANQTWCLEKNDKHLMHLALLEDLSQPWSDLTTDCLMQSEKRDVRASVISKESRPVILAGTLFIPHLFHFFNEPVEIINVRDDGDLVMPGDVLFHLQGDARTILMLERTVLNFVRHLSGIATLTHAFVERVSGTKTQILDTRKTTPGLRHFEKYAVLCGGGVNHRIGLYDALMVKDTHVDMLGGMAEILSRLPEQSEHTYPVIVEVRNQAELDVVLTQGLSKVSRVLLDNMSVPDLAKAVKACAGKCETESSGGHTLETITAVARTGVDYASVGMITHSSKHADFSMCITL